MKTGRKRWLCAALALVMVMGLIPGITLSALAASNEEPNYTTPVTSYDNLSNRLNALISKYEGTYWTTDGKAAASSGASSKYYYGKQCKGFASYIFNDLFCQGYIGAYDSNMYYIPSANGATLVGKAWDIGSSDTSTVKGILSQGNIGDLIQARRRGKDYGHTMIIAGVSDSGITIFDCNSDGKCGVKLYDQSWATFASKNSGFSLYHATNYPEKSDIPVSADIGDDFYGVILNTACWKPISQVEDSDKIYLKDEYGGSRQIWRFQRQDDGAYVISSCYDGKILEMHNGERVACTQLSARGDFWGGYYQQWYLIPYGSGYIFQSKHFTNEDWVMDLNNGDSSDGTRIQIFKRNNSSAQIWSVYKEDDVQLKGPELSVNVGTSLKETTFTWNHTYGATGYNLKIYKDVLWEGESFNQWSVSSGCSVALPAGNYVAYVDAWNHHLFKNGELVYFTVPYEEPPNHVDIGTNEYYYIANYPSWQQLESNQYNVQIATGGNDLLDPRQLWLFERQSDGSYVIINQYDNSVLDAYDYGTENGTNVTTHWNKAYTDNQKWFIQSYGDGYAIISAQSGYPALEIAGGQTAPGTNVQLWESNGTAAQRFAIYPPSEHNLEYKKPDKPAAPTFVVEEPIVAGKPFVVTWTESPKVNEFDKRVYNVIVADKDDKALDGTLTAVTGTSAQVTVFNKSAVKIWVTAVNAYYEDWYTRGEKKAIQVLNPCIISYSPNGGSGVPESQTVAEGQTVTLSTTEPTRDGYTFDGWYTAAQGGTKVTDSLVVNEDVTLYAHWTKIPEPQNVTLTYNPNGGTNAPAAQTVTAGGTVSLSTALPTRDGYTFDGWYTAAQDGTKVTGTLTVNEDTTLYAHWTKTETPVDPSAPTVTIVSATARPGGTVTLPVTLSNNPGIISLALDVLYDAGAMTLESVTDQGKLGTALHSNSLESPYRMSWNDDTAPQNHTDEGIIANLIFKFKETVAEGDYSVRVSFAGIDAYAYDVDLNDVTFAPGSGTVTVKNYTLGDVNDDDKIDGKDRTVLARYLAKWSGYDENSLNLLAADVNADGKVDAKDRTILARHLAKWVGYETLPYVN